MSYATLTHMRSTRYPMSGLGLGCIDGPPGTRGLGCGCQHPMGQVTITADTGTVFGVSALGLVAGGLGLWWLLSPHRSRPTTANRRRMRRNRRRRR